MYYLRAIVHAKLWSLPDALPREILLIHVGTALPNIVAEKCEIDRWGNVNVDRYINVDLHTMTTKSCASAYHLQLLVFQFNHDNVVMHNNLLYYLQKPK